MQHSHETYTTKPFGFFWVLFKLFIGNIVCLPHVYTSNTIYSTLLHMLKDMMMNINYLHIKRTNTPLTETPPMIVRWWAYSHIDIKLAKLLRETSKRAAFNVCYFLAV